MKVLTRQQVDVLRKHLIESGSDKMLLTELLDHLACEVEHYMWIGLPFEKAFEKVQLEVNIEAVSKLQDTYQYELADPDTPLQPATLDDIVFENRNKAYGAYDLRQTYPKAMRNALFLTLGLFLMLMALLGGTNQKSWSYTNQWGVMWMVGLCTTAFAGGSWYILTIKQKYTVWEE